MINNRNVYQNLHEVFKRWLLPLCVHEAKARAHIDFQQERWSVLPALLLASSFPKTLQGTIQIITLLHAW